MRAAGAVVAVAALVALAGCGGGNHARRDAVNAYFDRLEKAQAPVLLHSPAIATAFGTFSTVRSSPKETAALVRAHTLLARVGARVRAVHPPAEAARMQRDIERLYALQTGVAAELVQMIRFVPAYRKALTPLQPAHAMLSTELKVAKGWQAIAAAFKRYRLSLVAVLAKLDALAAPATLRPSFVAQRRSIRQSVVSCSAIEAALARKDRKGTALAINGLSGLGADSSLAKAQAAQIAATKAYNARLADVSTLQSAIGKERDKLVGALG